MSKNNPYFIDNISHDGGGRELVGQDDSMSVMSDGFGPHVLWSIGHEKVSQHTGRVY